MRAKLFRLFRSVLGQSPSALLPIIVCASAVLSGISSLLAAPIQGATATASSFFRSTSPTSAVSGAGLMTPDQPESGHTVVGEGNAWLTRRFDDPAGPDTNPWLIIDLGKIYNIEGFRVWNYNEPDGAGHGLKDVEIYYSSTNPQGIGSSLGKFVFAKSKQVGKEHLGQNFKAKFQARYIKLKIKNNWDGDNFGFGLAEIRFDGTPAPPPDLKVRLLIGAIETRTRDTAAHCTGRYTALWRRCHNNCLLLGTLMI
jgi:hypothetical protein